MITTASERADDEQHLLDVGPRHRLHAADDRVQHRRHADERDATSSIGQPKMAENTTAGAARIVPHDMPREIRNRNAVSERVLASNRRSRYSYAV